MRTAGSALCVGLLSVWLRLAGGLRCLPCLRSKSGSSFPQPRRACVPGSTCDENPPSIHPHVFPQLILRCPPRSSPGAKGAGKGWTT